MTTLNTEIDHRGVATLTLCRPELHNAFDDVLIEEMIDHLERLASNPGVRLLVLASRGKSFSAGADLGWMQRMAGYSESENEADALQLGRLMQTLNHMPIPTIARVQGAAFGGGVGLVACCDLVVACDRAQFCLSEVKLGLIPAVISPFVLDKIGVSASRRYFLTAERFPATEALRLGLVHEVVDADELDDAVARWVSTLLQNGPMAMGSAKALIQYVAHRPREGHVMEDTARRIAHIRASEEGREGVAAFLEKRPPNWLPKEAS